MFRNWLFKQFLIKKDERGLLFRKGDFVTILGPGEYTRFDLFNRLSVEVFPLRETRFEHRLADYLLQAEPTLITEHFHVITLGANELALCYENDVLVEVIPPNARRLYWKGFIAIHHERVDISENFAVARSLVPALTPTLRSGQKLIGADGVYTVQVPQFHAAALFVDGTLAQVLEAGLYGYFRFNRELRTETVDLRRQGMEVTGQEILTRDKVTLRINLSADYRFADVALAFARQARPVEYLYKVLQLGLRAAVGTRTLDELLENKDVLNEAVLAYGRQAVDGAGLVIESVGVKDIILPGEMKTLLAKVVEAEKAAQANVIRRREETAATRSLLNTAKVMEDNPVALRLKELETLEKVTEKIDRISVYGGLDGVLRELVKIRA